MTGLRKKAKYNITAAGLQVLFEESAGLFLFLTGKIASSWGSTGRKIKKGDSYHGKSENSCKRKIYAFHQ